MPLFFYTQLPCCTLRSCGHLCVSRVFTFFFSQLGDAVMWFWPFTSFQPRSVVHQNHSCATLPVHRWHCRHGRPERCQTLFLVVFSKEAAVRWLQYCWCRRSQLRGERLGQDPVGSAAPEPGRSGSFGPTKSVGFSLCSPPTQCVLWWLRHKRIAEWSFPLCSIKIRTFVQCNHTHLSTSWRHLIFVVIYSCHKTPSLKYQSSPWLSLVCVCVIFVSVYRF